MKVINLRDYYPFYQNDVHVEVPDRIAEVLHQFILDDAAAYLRRYRHGGLLSLDYGDDIERAALLLVLSPHEIVEQKEQKAQLNRAIYQLPEKQRSRICAYYLLGMTLQEIAESEGTSISTVQEGIQRGLRRLKKNLNFFDDPPGKKPQK